MTDNDYLRSAIDHIDQQLGKGRKGDNQHEHRDRNRDGSQ